MSLEAVHIRIIKRFQFPELVFVPRALKKEFKCLNDPSWHEKFENFEKGKPLPHFAIGDTFELIPIANPLTPEERFWHPFTIMDNAFKENAENFKGQALPLFAGKICFPQPSIDKHKFEKSVSIELEDFQYSFHGRLFPAGIVDAHFDLYIRFANAQESLSAIQKFVTVLAHQIAIQDASGRKYNGILSFFDQIMQSFFTTLFESNHPKYEAMPGYYTCFLFQDGYLEWEAHLRELAPLLLRRNQPERTDLWRASKKVLSALKKIHNYKTDDLIIIGKRTAICDVDPGLWEQAKRRNRNRTSIIESRNCFWAHFVNTLELAYITPLLMDEYMKYFRDGLNVLATEFFQAPADEAGRLFFLETLHGLETGYATQQSSVSEGRIQQMLHDTRTHWTGRHPSWETHYLKALDEMRSISQTESLKQIAEEVCAKIRDPQILEMERLVAIGKTQ